MHIFPQVKIVVTNCFYVPELSNTAEDGMLV